MRQFFSGITRREAQFTVAGSVLALVVCMPLLARADPGMIPGNSPADPGAEQAMDVQRGDSCRDLLPADTPTHVVCHWLTPPQDAAEVAAFWAADGGANLEAAEPLSPTASATVRPSPRRSATTSSTSAPTPTATPVESLSPDATASPAATDQPGTAAIKAARAAGLRIWVESDLADDYLAGATRFRTALDALAEDARQPGVIGVKFADNLAYSGFTSADDVEAFLSHTVAVLRQAVPGKRLAIGVVVPELGCGAATACVAAMRDKAPLATKELVERYIKASAVEQVYVSNGLFASAYHQHQLHDPKTGKQQPITPAIATRAQWLSIKALDWDTLAQISSREYGLAHSGTAAPWDDAQATAQINARIGTVIGLGVPTVTLWGHHAVDGGRTYRLLDADLASNRLWSQLIRQQLRERLSVVFDPRSTELGIRQDIAALSKAAGEIFILV
ncbi:hypothetical protein AB0K05_41455 [Nonomuraea sp. NPDC049486]|uniref:hypothetical protein n=1 Tax=Nonomuraea sp. NPDC049486 TaxID=3155773 RepID=UPI00341D81AB